MMGRYDEDDDYRDDVDSSEEEEIDVEEEEETSEDSSEEKTRTITRGRAIRSTVLSSATATTATRTLARRGKEEPVAKRGRGRPRKNATNNNKTVKKTSSSPPAPGKRKRGRPPKNKQGVVQSASSLTSSKRREEEEEVADDDTTFKCAKCGKGFETQEGLGKHSYWCSSSRITRSGRNKKVKQGSTSKGAERRGNRKQAQLKRETAKEPSSSSSTEDEEEGEDSESEDDNNVDGDVDGGGVLRKEEPVVCPKCRMRYRNQESLDRHFPTCTQINYSTSSEEEEEEESEEEADPPNQNTVEIMEQQVPPHQNPPTFHEEPPHWPPPQENEVTAPPPIIPDTTPPSAETTPQFIRQPPQTILFPQPTPNMMTPQQQQPMMTPPPPKPQEVVRPIPLSPRGPPAPPPPPIENVGLTTLTLQDSITGHFYRITIPIQPQINTTNPYAMTAPVSTPQPYGQPGQGHQQGHDMDSLRLQQGTIIPPFQQGRYGHFPPQQDQYHAQPPQYPQGHYFPQQPQPQAQMAPTTAQLQMQILGLGGQQQQQEPAALPLHSPTPIFPQGMTPYTHSIRSQPTEYLLHHQQQQQQQLMQQQQLSLQQQQFQLQQQLQLQGVQGYYSQQHHHRPVVPQQIQQQQSFVHSQITPHLLPRPHHNNIRLPQSQQLVQEEVLFQHQAQQAQQAQAQLQAQQQRVQLQVQQAQAHLQAQIQAQQVPHSNTHPGHTPGGGQVPPHSVQQHQQFLILQPQPHIQQQQQHPSLQTPVERYRKVLPQPPQQRSSEPPKAEETRPLRETVMSQLASKILEKKTPARTAVVRPLGLHPLEQLSAQISQLESSFQRSQQQTPPPRGTEEIVIERPRSSSNTIKRKKEAVPDVDTADRPPSNTLCSSSPSKITLTLRRVGPSFSVGEVKGTDDSEKFSTFASLKITGKVQSGDLSGKKTEVVIYPKVHSIPIPSEGDDTNFTIPEGGNKGGNEDEEDEAVSPQEVGKLNYHAVVVYEVHISGRVMFRSGNVHAVWSTVLETVQGTRLPQTHLPALSYPPTVLAAENRGGLKHRAVQFLLKHLPQKNTQQRAAAVRDWTLNKEEEDDSDVKENETGCARTEGYKGRKPFDMFGWLASKHRKPLEKMSSSCEEMIWKPQMLKSNGLPASVRYRSLKERFPGLGSSAYVVMWSTIHGRGLYTRRDIDQGELVIEYAGEVIRSLVCDAREKYYETKGIGCYMFRINDENVIDATLKGNAARFINHSCEPNCESRNIRINGVERILIFAMRRISSGEELTYDYKFEREKDNRLPCACAADRCRKYLN